MPCSTAPGQLVYLEPQHAAQTRRTTQRELVRRDRGEVEQLAQPRHGQHQRQEPRCAAHHPP